MAEKRRISQYNINQDIFWMQDSYDNLNKNNNYKIPKCKK